MTGRAAVRPGPKPGDTFTHKHYLDPWWKPAEGERYSDAPHAVMEVTRVTRDTVYYTYADSNTGRYKMPREQFEREYPTPEETP